MTTVTVSTQEAAEEVDALVVVPDAEVTLYPNVFTSQ